jgi:hypothetical protein
MHLPCPSGTFYDKVGFSGSPFLRGHLYLYRFALPHAPFLMFAAVSASASFKPQAPSSTLQAGLRSLRLVPCGLELVGFPPSLW